MGRGGEEGREEENGYIRGGGKGVKEAQYACCFCFDTSNHLAL